LADKGFSAAQLALLIDVLVRDRASRHSRDERIELVTTGPESYAVMNRDTGVVVRDLFAGAEQSVLVVGYAVFQGRAVFEALADRMRDCPELFVRLFLDVRRNPGD